MAHEIACRAVCMRSRGWKQIDGVDNHVQIREEVNNSHIAIICLDRHAVGAKRGLDLRENC
jgi:hypothetical protein